VFRGYLGAGLQRIQDGHESNGSQGSSSGRGVLVVSIDPAGPSACAGMFVGEWQGFHNNHMALMILIDVAERP
jgi:hypothetical protein